MEFSRFAARKAFMRVISLGFMLWSAVFIYLSSFIAIDGKRYFCLRDDAMISMRYAWNFSHGLGLVWNLGEHVQGYSNLLMVLLMSLATLVLDKSAAVLSIQLAGVGFMLAIAYVSMKIAEHLRPAGPTWHGSLLGVLAFLGALFYYPLAYWSLMGMETGLLTLLLLVGVLAALRYSGSRNPAHLGLVAGSLGLAFLTRNDSLVIALLIWAFVAWEVLACTPAAANRKMLWPMLAALACYFIFIAGQLAFQYLYYGAVMPNTYTLKLGGIPLSTRLTDGIGFITPFLGSTAAVLIVSAFGILLDFSRRKALLFSIVLSTIAYEIYVGGDPWSYWRIMSPSMPLLFILFSSAILAITHAASGTKAIAALYPRYPKLLGKGAARILVITLALIGMASTNVAFREEITFIARPEQSEENQNNVNTAIAISQFTTSEASVGVIWAGALPYYTDRRAIDFLGKSDAYIARLDPDLSGAVSWSGMTSVPGHNKYNLNYSIKRLQPTFVQDFRWGKQDLRYWAKTRYAKIEYLGTKLYFLRDSPAVLWSKIPAQ